jgi:F-type H+-transporting ATPase subunit b
MDSETKSVFGEALKTSPDPVIVRSAFDLPEKQRSAIHYALNTTFSSEINVQFVTAPDIISGIEVTAQGQKVAWSIGEYLASMEQLLGDLLKGKDKPKVFAEPVPETKSI